MGYRNEANIEGGGGAKKILLFKRVCKKFRTHDFPILNPPPPPPKALVLVQCILKVEVNSNMALAAIVAGEHSHFSIGLQTHENSALAEFAVKTAKYAEFTYESGIYINQR